MNTPKIVLLITVLFSSVLSAQNKKDTSKVLMPSIGNTYIGPLKKGLASGNGEAFGIHHYIGMFKYGKPNGKGTYYYNDSIYYSGEFQDGIKEGKGEMHDARKKGSDSLIKGYWSGDEYRGDKYITYVMSGANDFDKIDINNTGTGGNEITIEISTTTGSPTQQMSTSINGNGFVLLLTDLICMDNPSYVRHLSTFKTAIKSSWTFQIMKFPIKLRAEMSNGKSFTLDLYKTADWTVKLYMNK